jgi:hypothetical protein
MTVAIYATEMSCAHAQARGKLLAALIYLGRLERIFRGEDQLEVEDASSVRAALLCSVK